MKYALLIPFLLMASNLYAAEIDSSSGIFNTSNATGTAVQNCEKVLLIKRNVGTLVQGLKTANFKLYQATHIADNTSPTSGKATNPIKVTYSLATTTTPGVYNLCVTPSDFSWTINDSYEFRFLINGSNGADNGSYLLKLQN